MKYVGCWKWINSRNGDIEAYIIEHFRLSISFLWEPGPVQMASAQVAAPPNIQSIGGGVSP